MSTYAPGIYAPGIYAPGIYDQQKQCKDMHDMRVMRDAKTKCMRKLVIFVHASIGLGTRQLLLLLWYARLLYASL